MLGSRKVGCKVTVSAKYNLKLQEIVFYMNKKKQQKNSLSQGGEEEHV